MIDMRKLSISIVTVMLLTCSLAGCFGDEDKEEKEPGFVWPEQVEKECNISNQSGLVCDFYFGVNSTPVLTLDEPNSDAIWLLDLDGTITKWEQSDDQTLPIQTGNLADLSNVVSRCHFEQ